jgi:hypothetical protein
MTAHFSYTSFPHRRSHDIAPHASCPFFLSHSSPYRSEVSPSQPALKPIPSTPHLFFSTPESSTPSYIADSDIIVLPRFAELDKQFSLPPSLSGACAFPVKLNAPIAKASACGVLQVEIGSIGIKGSGDFVLGSVVSWVRLW